MWKLENTNKTRKQAHIHTEQTGGCQRQELRAWKMLQEVKKKDFQLQFKLRLLLTELSRCRCNVQLGTL